MDEKKIIKKLKGLLETPRFKHSLRVRKTILDLSKHHKIPFEKASIAGLLHDASRFMDSKKYLDLAKRLKFKVGPIARSEPKLLHACLSSHIARTMFGIRDKQILRAIYNHTIGRKNMSVLEKIVYIADHIEEGRTHAAARKARRQAKKDLDQAIITISSSMINYLLKKNLPIHPGTVEVRNYYLMQK